MFVPNSLGHLCGRQRCASTSFGRRHHWTESLNRHKGYSFSANRKGTQFALVIQDIPKNWRAMNSIHQITCGISNIPKLANGKRTKEAIIPMPHTRKITLRFFLLGVGLGRPLVNWNSELYARIPKNSNADIIWMISLVFAISWKVPILPLFAAQGNRHTPQAQMPAAVFSKLSVRL